MGDQNKDAGKEKIQIKEHGVKEKPANFIRPPQPKPEPPKEKKQ